MTDRVVNIARSPAGPVSAPINESNEKTHNVYCWDGETLTPPLSAVLFRNGGQLGCCRIRGVGPHGVRLETDALVSEDEFLQVRFLLMEKGRGVQYDLSGRVLSHGTHGMGLLTDVLVAAAGDGLNALLAFNRQTPELVVVD
ncbi:MAG: hypothetical protein V2J55_11165 [Candidatus Competibacteraceae bacterium]|nr:hypothetical protein [Candidatus Competibacteraceae bacterium]